MEALTQISKCSYCLDFSRADLLPWLQAEHLLLCEVFVIAAGKDSSPDALETSAFCHIKLWLDHATFSHVGKTSQKENGL